MQFRLVDDQGRLIVIVRGERQLPRPAMRPAVFDERIEHHVHNERNEERDEQVFGNPFVFHADTLQAAHQTNKQEVWNKQVEVRFKTGFAQVVSETSFVDWEKCFNTCCLSFVVYAVKCSGKTRIIV